ncbi:hypothetical protein NZD85_06335 [Empedobacter stercoris]|uniref:hypothetical protein n=1 Tax=Empedobacter stercoris TaxID=1628248 RepID=UPI0021AF6ACF|nr:hypothetical protein [Empedobacter stercoris]UWX68210.1 hypothetical protein NZD85_06335 [Empedobacter stercoris]
MKLIERKEIFQNYNNITSLIKGFQKAFFDEEYDNLEDEMFDALNLEPKKASNSTFNLSINHSVLDTFPKKLSERINCLFDFLNVEQFIIISHLKLDLFGNTEHDYDKVKNSYEQLKKITLSESYKEAILADKKDLPELIDILFWLERCDGSLPEYIFWFDTNERFCFHLCQYGKVHIIDFTNGNLLNNEQLAELQFEIVEDRCYDQFTEESRIENRKLKL